MSDFGYHGETMMPYKAGNAEKFACSWTPWARIFYRRLPLRLAKMLTSWVNFVQADMVQRVPSCQCTTRFLKARRGRQRPRLWKRKQNSCTIKFFDSHHITSIEDPRACRFPNQLALLVIIFAQQLFPSSEIESNGISYEGRSIVRQHLCVFTIQMLDMLVHFIFTTNNVFAYLAIQ